MLWQIALEEKAKAQMKNLVRWIGLISEIPEVKATFGKLRECKKEFPVGVFEKKEE